MKRSFTVLALAGSLALAGCTSAGPVDDVASVVASAPSAASSATPEAPYSFFGAGERPTPKVDTSAEKSFSFEDGLKVTFENATVAPAEQVGSDPVEGMTPVTLTFTYDNGSTAAIPLQPVPFTVMYGADLYEANQPTLYQGDPSHTELPKQISAGSTVKASNTYWVPAGEPITVIVNVNGSDEPLRPAPMFSGITVK